MSSISRRSSLATMMGLPILAAESAVSASVNPLSRIRSVERFGVIGDGVADDTAAFQAVFDSGDDIVVPPARAFYRITRPLALRRSGQSISGMGVRSHIVFDPAAAVGNLLVSEHADCSFANLHLTPSPRVGDLFDGWAIGLVGAHRATIEGCHFTGLRRGAILLSDSDEGHVRHNLFASSLVRGDGSERQTATGYDVLVAGTSSRNLVSANRCFSGVGTAIGCQTVAAGKSQRGNVICNNVIRGYPAYGIMVYLSDPDATIDAVTIAGNAIENVSGSVLTDGQTRFYGCGIYLQSTNDPIVTGNRIVNSNSAHDQPFASGAVPAAIGLSGYGNAIISNNMIDGCHHGIASIQTTAPPRRGDATIVADNIVRQCRGAGIWLGDGTAARVHDNHLTAARPGGTHGVMVRRFASSWMDRFAIHDNDVTDFAIGIEVSGERIGSADITGNRVRNNTGNGIYCAAAMTIVQRNDVSGAFGIAIGENARTGICRDNVLRTTKLAIVDDLGSGVRVEDNILVGGGSFSSDLAVLLATGPAPRILAKRWVRKEEGSMIERLIGGYQGQTVSILAETQFRVRHGAGLFLTAARDMTVARGTILSLVMMTDGWHEIG